MAKYACAFNQSETGKYFEGIINNYSPKWRWLAMDGYLPSRAAVRQIPTAGHHKKLIWMISSVVTDANRNANFFSSCSEVNSTGYSEFD